MKKIFLTSVMIILALTMSAQKTQYYDLIIQKTTPLLHLYGAGGVINWNNGDITLTHSSNKITLAGGDLELGLGNFLADTISSGPISMASSTSGIALKINSGYHNADSLVRIRQNNVTKLSIDTAGGINLYGTNAISLNGTATVWEDLRFPFSTGNQGFNTYPPFNTDSLYFSFTVDSAGNDAQFMYFIIQFPHKWKVGSVIKPHIHYKQEAPSGATPVYLFRYKWYPLGGSTRKGWSWYTMNTATDTIRYTHQLLYGTGGITPPALVIGVSSEIVGIVYLKSLAAGTTASNSWEFDIHFEIDKLGSRTETAE